MKFYPVQAYPLTLPLAYLYYQLVMKSSKRELRIFSLMLRLISLNLLVELLMTSSKLKKLWSGVQNVRHLKKINLSCTKDLIEMPDLSMAVNLENIDLSWCDSLRELHPSILSLPKLEILDLFGCEKIESLKSNIPSKSLRELILGHCTSLVEFSFTSEQMTLLNLENTAIREVPSSNWRKSDLEVVDIRSCYTVNINGKRLSNDHPRIRSLTTLNISWCQQIDALNLSHLLDSIRSLKQLYMCGCQNLEALPQNIQKHSELNYIELDECYKLVLSSEMEMHIPPYLRCVSARNCTLMDTNTTQMLLFENSLLKIKNGTLKDGFTNKFGYYTFLFIPGYHRHVLRRFDFENANGASITIPPIPKSNLKAFLFCILLLERTWMVKHTDFSCNMYEDGKQVRGTEIRLNNHYGSLDSDHVLLCLFDCDIGESGNDDYCNLSFEFSHWDKEEDSSTESIKGCGVQPIYSLEHVQPSSVANLESTAEATQFEAAAEATQFKKSSLWPLFPTKEFLSYCIEFVPASDHSLDT